MKQIVLQNFRNPSVGYSTNLHRLVSGFVPHYTDLASETSDTDFRDKVNPAYSLVLAPSMAILDTQGTLRIVAITEKSGAVITNSTTKVIYATNLWDIYFEDPTEENFTTQPTTVSGTSDGVDLEVFQGDIVTSFYSNAKIKYNGGATSTAWSDHTGADVSTAALKLFRKFKDGLMVSDVSYIRTLTSSFALSALADSFRLVVANVIQEIIDYNNFSDQYMVVFFENAFAGLANPAPLYDRTDWVLWNGLDTAVYEFHKTIRGKYRCCIVRDNTIYAFTQLGTTLICWQFTGFDFREYGRIKNVVVSTELSNPKMRVSLENDFFVLMAHSPDNVSTESPFYWNPATGDNFFMVEQAQDGLAVLISQQSDGTYQRYISTINPSTGTGSVLQKIVLESTGRHNTASYKSGVIAIPEGRGKINRVIVEYNEAPTTVSDRIDFTLSTKDETEAESLTTNSAIIKDTTGNSTNANVSAKRAIMEFKPLCTELEISLSLTKTTASYWLIVRKIIIEYEPVMLKN